LINVFENLIRFLWRLFSSSTISVSNLDLGLRLELNSSSKWSSTCFLWKPCLSH
jgi:hypothetical protein